MVPASLTYVAVSLEHDRGVAVIGFALPRINLLSLKEKWHHSY
jgi:hypothetical protein